MKTRIVVCASGEGSNFQALVEATKRGELQAEVVGLIANKKKIGAIGRARIFNIPHAIFSIEDYRNRSDWDQAMLHRLREWRADWVVLAGFLALVGPSVLEAFPKKIVNSHPALLPKHGGKGMYGERVHKAVLRAKDAETGVSFHYVEQEYDRGPIIEQFRIPVLSGESPAQLMERVKHEENRLYPLVLARLIGLSS